MAIIAGRRELDYEEKKFLAAIQGVDLEQNEEKGQKEWEDLKARVFSGGKAKDGNDVLALQGQNAVKAGFGIGFGLDYEDLR
jgi:translation initiation factor 1 (eIF-1/SUI1)